MSFKPKRVFFERDALAYPLGEALYGRFKREGIDLAFTGSHNRVTGIPGKTPRQAYLEAKDTLVVGVRRTLKFESCKPSAHYQLPLGTSCTGRCEYCYLNTTLGNKPYLRVYVNVDEILDQAGNYINARLPETTIFEGAATSDPVPVEEYTGSLKKTIEFFGKQEHGRFRFVTKFTDVDALLDAEHNNHTRFRFSLNSEHIISQFEHGTPRASNRIAAAKKVARAGYPPGFIIAPIILYQNWREGYHDLLQNLHDALAEENMADLTFELITHRFTARAKNRILEVFPETQLPMGEEERKYKYGQFGYGKYVYPKEDYEEVEAFFRERLERYFPGARMEYLV